MKTFETILFKGYCLYLPVEKEDVQVSEPSLIKIEGKKVFGMQNGQVLLRFAYQNEDILLKIAIIDDERYPEKSAWKEAQFKGEKTHENVKTMFIGDSFFDVEDFWFAFHESYPKERYHSMGIGGSRAMDWLFYSQRLLFPFKPENVVIHVGTNDINDEGVDSQTAFERLKRLVQEIHLELSQAHIYLCGIEASVLFAQNWPKAKAADVQLEQLAKDDPLLTYIDSPNAFINEAKDGVDPALLLDDGLHPRASTYEIYQRMLKQAGLN